MRAGGTSRTAHSPYVHGHTQLVQRTHSDKMASSGASGEKKKKKGDCVSRDSCSVEEEKTTRDEQENYVRSRLMLKGYVLGAELGRGAFAVVRKAMCVKEKTKCAVKIVDCTRAPQDFVKYFFPRELAVIRKLKYENVIDVIDIVKVNWLTCIVMERAGGGNIVDYLMEKGPMDEDTANKVFRQAMMGLRYCHDLNVAHRDLKCENLLLTEDLKVKIADFGFTRYVVDSNNKRVLSETYCGSEAYTAPEVLLNQPYDPIMADMWAMGVVLYVMLCAALPFDAPNIRQTISDQLSRNWSFVSERRVSATCRRLVRQLLEPDVTKRLTMKQAHHSTWLGGRSEGGLPSATCHGATGTKGE